MSLTNDTSFRYKFYSILAHCGWWHHQVGVQAGDLQISITTITCPSILVNSHHYFTTTIRDKYKSLFSHQIGKLTESLGEKWTVTKVFNYNCLYWVCCLIVVLMMLLSSSSLAVVPSLPGLYQMVVQCVQKRRIQSNLYARSGPVSQATNCPQSWNLCK